MITENDSQNRSLNDEDRLIQKLKQGDSLAFESVYHLYFQRLYVYCLQFTKSRSDAEDIVQDIFAKLWLNREQIKQESSLRGLLFTMVRNDLVSAFRRNVSSPVFEDYQDYVHTLGAEDARWLEYREFENAMMKAIEELPDSRRNILKLSRFEHLNNKQIAEKLGINEQSVKNSISQSLKFIRSRFKDLLLILVLVLLK